MLVKTVNIQVLGGSSPWTRPSTPECCAKLKALASFGRSCCAAVAKRRLNVQSGLRKSSTEKVLTGSGWVSSERTLLLRSRV